MTTTIDQKSEFRTKSSKDLRTRAKSLFSLLAQGLRIKNSQPHEKREKQVEVAIPKMSGDPTKALAVLKTHLKQSKDCEKTCAAISPSLVKTYECSEPVAKEILFSLQTLFEKNSSKEEKKRTLEAHKKTLLSHLEENISPKARELLRLVLKELEASIGTESRSTIQPEPSKESAIIPVEGPSCPIAIGFVKSDSERLKGEPQADIQPISPPTSQNEDDSWLNTISLVEPESDQERQAKIQEMISKAQTMTERLKAASEMQQNVSEICDPQTYSKNLEEIGKLLPDHHATQVDLQKFLERNSVTAEETAIITNSQEALEAAYKTYIASSQFNTVSEEEQEERDEEYEEEREEEIDPLDQAAVELQKRLLGEISQKKTLSESKETSRVSSIEVQDAVQGTAEYELVAAEALEASHPNR